MGRRFWISAVFYSFVMGTLLMALSLPVHAQGNESAPTQADTMTTVSCPAGVSYNGQAQTPCTATVTGPGFSQWLNVTYANNANAGTATANASFSGDSTSAPSSGSAAFNIAPELVVITAGGYSGVYDGSTHAFSACTVGFNFDHLSCTNSPASMGDVGGSIVMPMISSDTSNYSVIVNNGIWSITPAASITTVTCLASVTYNGAEQTPCSATVMGINLNQPLQVVYTNNVNIGTATANATYSGDLNHTYSSASTQFTIVQTP